MQMPPHLLDGALPLEGSWQHDDRELRLVPPAPPVRRLGDLPGGRGACAARVYKIVITYNRRYSAYSEHDARKYQGSIV